MGYKQPHVLPPLRDEPADGEYSASDLRLPLIAVVAAMLGLVGFSATLLFGLIPSLLGLFIFGLLLLFGGTLLARHH